MGRNPVSPDRSPSGDDVTAASAGGYSGLRHPFKRNVNPFIAAAAGYLPSNRAKSSPVTPRHSRSHHHGGRSAARRLMLCSFRGRSLFYFCVFFSIFVFAMASMVLQSSIAAMFKCGGERGRLVREGLRFGSSLRFIPAMPGGKSGLDQLRQEARVGVRPPKLALQRRGGAAPQLARQLAYCGCSSQQSLF